MPLVIYPYLLFDSTWVFDDEMAGLKEEAFVCGMSEMISRMIAMKGILNASEGFEMSFSDKPFDDHDVELKWLRADEPKSLMPGNWYSGTISGEEMEGWLCPALFCYFDAAPKRLFVKAGPLPPNIDPIWHIAPDDPRQRRFMGPEDNE